MKPSRDISRLIEVMAALRTPVTGCPWDLEQDFATIAPYTVEEAYEVADAIARGDLDDLKDELGDLLLQVVYHARMAEEQNAFAFGDVVEAVTRKMIRRHPHVFGDRAAETAGDVVRNWNQIKRDDERGGEIFGDIPETLPSTLYAKKVLKRAADAGRGSEPADGLLAAVKRVVDAGEDPELALRRAADEYRREVEAQ